LGQFCYVRDVGSDSAWSVGSQPLPKCADESGFEFHGDRAEFWRRDGDVETRSAIGVVTDADAEVAACESSRFFAKRHRAPLDWHAFWAPARPNL
jgi:hypothetical protein